jgi:hypothetical protein
MKNVFTVLLETLNKECCNIFLSNVIEKRLKKFLALINFSNFNFSFYKKNSASLGFQILLILLLSQLVCILQIFKLYFAVRFSAL